MRNKIIEARRGRAEISSGIQYATEVGTLQDRVYT
jgi:hypothetical protein